MLFSISGMNMGEREFKRAVAYLIVKRAVEQAAETVSREWDAKQEEWLARQEANIAGWAEQYNNNLDRIVKLDENIEKLTDRLKHTQDKKQIAKIEGWTAESVERKAELDCRNKNLREKIGVVEAKLNQGAETPFYYRESQNGGRPGRRSTFSTKWGTFSTPVKTSGRKGF